MLEKVDATNITAHLGPVVQKDTLLISDGKGVYAMFARARKLLHVWVVIKKGEPTWAGAHIQNVNAYISGLKTWRVRFRGAATKHLESYLGWRRQIDRVGDDLPDEQWMIGAVT